MNIIQPIANARDANNDINPNEVKNAVENIKKVFNDEFDTLAANIDKAAIEEAIVINGQDMSASITDAAATFRNLGPELTADVFDTIVESAVNVHNNLQQQYNNAVSQANQNGDVSTI